MPIEFDGHVLKENKLKIDMVIEGQVVVENKAVVEMIPLFEAQTLTYLRQGKMRLGYLINYNVTLIKNGIKRLVV